MSILFWKSRTVLVTGSTGLLGGWLIKRLLNEGAHVIAMLRGASTRSFVTRNCVSHGCMLAESDLCDDASLNKLVAMYAPQTVFHLAAQTQVGEAERDPSATFETNVRGTWLLMEACRRSGVEQVIYSSSDKVYGPTSNLPHIESQQTLAEYHPYGLAKSCAEQIIRMFSQAYGLHVGIARCGNIFGGGDMNFGRLVPGIVRDAFQGKPITIHGDGKSVRDFLYVEDAVTAFMLMAERLASSPTLSGEVFNLSLQMPVSVLEMVETVLTLMKRLDLLPVTDRDLAQSNSAEYLCTQKAQTVLGWSPAFDLTQGLLRTIQWYEEYFNTVEAHLKSGNLAPQPTEVFREERLHAYKGISGRPAV